MLVNENPLNECMQIFDLLLNSKFSGSEKQVKLEYGIKFIKNIKSGKEMNASKD